MQQTGNDTHIWDNSLLNMVLRSVSCQQDNHKYDKYALQLWISTELVPEKQFYRPTIKKKGKCIPSACESVYHEIFVPRRETVRLRPQNRET